MVESRWLRWVGPGVISLGAVGFIASTTLGAAVRPWAPSVCAGPPAARVAAARDQGSTSLAALRGTPWFRLDPVLDTNGALTGQRLALGRDGDRSARTMDLTAEAFAAGPFGGIVLVGSDDGVASRLQAIDAAAGCAWPIASERDVIRRATVDPAGAFIYEMRVERASRADLGIWRRPLDGMAPAQPVLGPPPPDARFGRTFSTEFSWDATGDRLAVQSCGDIACRTRVLAPRGDPTLTLDDPGLGLLVGLDGDIAVTYEACRGLPCPIVAIDMKTRTRRALAADAGLALMVKTANGSRLVHEVGAGTHRGLRSIASDGTDARDLGRIPDDLRLHPSAVRAEAATRIPTDWVLLAPDGRLPADGDTSRSRLRHVPDGSTVALDEAMR